MRFSIAPALQRVERGQRVFDMDGFLAECEVAERCGWYAAYTGEKHAGDTSYTTNPALVCAVGLARTKRLRFCTGVTVLPVHHPVSVAEDGCLLDAMFPGRFRLTTGAGYFQGDYDPFGVSLDERHHRMEVGMEVIAAHREGRRIPVPAPWTGTVAGRDAALGPDRLEVFIGAWSAPGVRRAARQADGWVTDPLRSGRWMAHLARIYREECEKVGKKPRIVLLREAWLGRDDESARATYGPHVLGYSRVYFRRGNAYDPRFDPWLKDVSDESQLTLDHVLPDRVLCGATDTWLEQIAHWQETIGPEEIILRLRHFEGPSLGETLECIERITQDILPRVS